MLRKHKLKITVSVMSVIFTLVMYLVMTIMTSVPAVSASDIPTLFVNDMFFHAHARLPLEKINGVFYIPVEIIRSMQSIRTTSSDHYTNYFVLLNQSRNIGLSFNVDAGAVWCHNNNLVAGAAAVRIGRQTYVPAVAVANALGLHIDIAEPVSGHYVLRIRDWSSMRSLDELLGRFPIPQPEPPPPTTTPPPPPPPTRPPPRPPHQQPTTPPHVILPYVPETTTNPQNTRNINNYLMFHNFRDSHSYYGHNIHDNSAGENRGENLEYLLGFLNENEIRALFFMSGEEILENPANVRRIFAFGHDIGININNADYVYAEDIVSSVEGVNALIYTLIKQKTRLYTVTANFGDVFMREAVASLYEAGYFLSRGNINAEAMPQAFEDLYEAVDFLRQQQENLWVFDISSLQDSRAKMKMEIIAYASNERFYINFSHINSANVSELVQ